MKVQINRPSGPPEVTQVPDGTCVYATINGRVYYIDDSTNEQIVKQWPECECPNCDYKYDLVPVKVDN